MQTDLVAVEAVREVQIKDLAEVGERLLVGLVQIEVENLPEVLLDVLFSKEDLGL